MPHVYNLRRRPKRGRARPDPYELCCRAHEESSRPPRCSPRAHEREGGRSADNAASSQIFAASIGLVACSCLKDARYENRTVLFVENIFVCEDYRGIKCAMLLFQCIVKWAQQCTHVALLVRKNAPQQAHARKLYTRLGLKCTNDFKDMFFMPRADQTYMHATIEVVCQALVHENVCCRLKGTFVRQYPNTRRRWNIVLRENDQLMQRLLECHCVEYGGDGADPREVISRADMLFVLCTIISQS